MAYAICSTVPRAVRRRELQHVYIYIYIYMHIYIYIYIYICICTYAFVYTHIYIYVSRPQVRRVSLRAALVRSQNSTTIRLVRFAKLNNVFVFRVF